MIILDIETTGLSPTKNAMISLGAVDFNSGKKFYCECQVGPNDEVNDGALAINGFTKDQITDYRKLKAVDLYVYFLEWANQFEDRVIGGHNVGHFDILFLERYHQELNETLKNKIKWPFGYRTVDLHSIAYAVFGESLSHEKICEKLGLPVEEKPHNALTGAWSEAAALKTLLVYIKDDTRNLIRSDVYFRDFFDETFSRK